MASKPPPAPINGKLVATVGTAAAAILTATVAMWEGKVNDPHWDRYAKIYDVCYGETRVPMRHYTDAECTAMLQDALAGFAEGALKRNPELRDRPHMLAAAVSLRYNIGGAAYDRSTVAKRFSQGRWREACDAFLAWNRAGGRVVQGLVNRRKHERELCLRDAV